MTRTIGIRHRRKKTIEGEARPTTVAIKVEDKFVCHDLENETDELDFLPRRFPIQWEVAPETDIVWLHPKNAPTGIRPHHCKWKKICKEEVATGRTNHVRKSLDSAGKPVNERLTKIPVKFEGLLRGDSVAMVLGGSGDRFAAALSRRGEEIGAQVFRTPPSELKEKRETIETSKDNDHLTLAVALGENPLIFYQLRRKDRDIIAVKEALSLRQDALKARIGCEQRIYQSLVGRIFLSEEGRYPEGLIEDEYDRIKASDAILQGLLAEEKCRDKELERVVTNLEIWERIFKQVKGCGPRIAAGIIAGLGDIRRFVVPVNYDGADTAKERHNRKFKAIGKTLAKVKAFCGVHVLPDGSFPRRRAGQLANWSPLVRQSLYLLTDQFNRRPNTVWGKKLLAQKEKYRQTHPEPVEVEVEFRDGNEKFFKYSDGHIHKMALWHTASKFIEWMSREWLKIEEVY